MIGKQIKGRGFRGVLDYVESKRGAQRLGGNMFGETARELSAEFRLSRQLNPKVERAVYHVSLSLKPGEYLGDEQWNQVAERYLLHMGFNYNQYVVYRHTDQSHDHIHLIASRIKLDGTLVHDGWDYLRSEPIIRDLERDYNLARPIELTPGKRSPTTGQKRRWEREHQEFLLGHRDQPPELPVLQQLQSILDRAVVDHPSLSKLIKRLELQGVDSTIVTTANGTPRGIKYKYKGIHFSGTNLGKDYTLPGLQKHQGVSLAPELEIIPEVIPDVIQPAPEPNQTVQDWLQQKWQLPIIPLPPEPQQQRVEKERTEEQVRAQTQHNTEEFEL